MEVFTQHHAVPFSKMLTFYRKEPFSINAYYSGQIPFPDNYIGKFIVKDVKPNADGESAKVKVKVRVNIHGILSVTSARRETVVDNDQQNAADDQNGQRPEPMEASPSPAMDNSESGENVCNAEEEAEKKEAKKSGKKITVTELPIEAFTHGYSLVELNNYIELECKMIASDRQEKERVDTRNALEEYIYELRGELSTEPCTEPNGRPTLCQFVKDGDHKSLIQQLDQLENWLYEDGDDCNRQTYAEKLVALKSFGEPIKARQQEFEQRPYALTEFAQLVQAAQTVIEQYRAGSKFYNHLTEADITKVHQSVDIAVKWLDTKRQEFNSYPLTENPVVTVAQIRQEKLNFDQIVSPIANKPKPKPTPPQPAEPQNQQNGQTAGTDAGGDQKNPPPPPHGDQNSTETMDVD